MCNLKIPCSIVMGCTGGDDAPSFKDSVRGDNYRASDIGVQISGISDKPDGGMDSDRDGAPPSENPNAMRLALEEAGGGLVKGK